MISFDLERTAASLQASQTARRVPQLQCEASVRFCSAALCKKLFDAKLSAIMEHLYLGMCFVCEVPGFSLMGS